MAKSKLLTAKPTSFGMENIPRWKQAMWVFVGHIKGRIMVRLRRLKWQKHR